MLNSGSMFTTSGMIFLHKLTTQLIRENDIICVEELNIQKYGKKDSQRAQAISDVSWGSSGDNFNTRQVVWEKRSYQSVRVSPLLSSVPTAARNGRERKICLSGNGRAPRVWGTVHDRDINAAKTS